MIDLSAHLRRHDEHQMQEVLQILVLSHHYVSHISEPSRYTLPCHLSLWHCSWRIVAKKSRRWWRLMALADVSADALEAVAALLDVPSLLVLAEACRALRLGLRVLIPQRCKRECFTAYLFPTIATYRMEAPVPPVSCFRSENDSEPQRVVFMTIVFSAPSRLGRGCT
jgi:hypothetical protein